MPETTSSAPRVFISYSWTNDEHTEWVGELGERLMADGVDVVLDQWSLEHGHDVHAFMERMVSDPSIKRVIIISDALYAAKADGRKGGVGTETQIISKEVYDSVDQTKFVPILRERDSEGCACLPIYLKNRWHIDFSNPDTEAQSYDDLLRNIFERPVRRKPAMGKPPSHIFDEDSTVVTSAQKAKRFRELVVSGKGSASAAFEDFADEFLSNLEELRMTYTSEGGDTWCDRIRENIESATVYRDIFVDVIKVGASHVPGEQFVPLFLNFLERLLVYQERPEIEGRFFQCSEDNYKLLCYEFFLYSIAAFIKAKKYSQARAIMDYRFVTPRTLGGNDFESHSFSSFNSYARSLEETCAVQGKRKRLSVMADLVHERANRSDLRFSDIMQADVILCLASRGSWYPRTLIYSRSSGKCELFLRAVDGVGFVPLEQLLRVDSPQELIELIGSPDIQRMLQSEKFWQANRSMEFLNLRELERCWQMSTDDF